MYTWQDVSFACPGSGSFLSLCCPKYHKTGFLSAEEGVNSDHCWVKPKIKNKTNKNKQNNIEYIIVANNGYFKLKSWEAYTEIKVFFSGVKQIVQQAEYII